jgi:hypothetical protein
MFGAESLKFILVWLGDEDRNLFEIDVFCLAVNCVDDLGQVLSQAQADEDGQLS